MRLPHVESGATTSAHAAAADRPVTERFVDYLRAERGLSPNTVTTYGIAVRQFAEWMDRTPILRTREKDIRAYLAYMVETGRSARTANHSLVILKEFFRYAVLEGLRRENPTRLVRGLRATKRAFLPLTQAQVGKLLEPGASLRDDAICETFYGSGIRVGELVGLELANVNLEDGTAYVVGKGNKERLVPLSHSTVKAIRAYLDARGPSRSRFLFTYEGRADAPITRWRVWQLLKARGVRAGVGHVHPHTLRRTFATVLLENGADILCVRDLLGHENVETTAMYASVSLELVKKAFAQYHPRATFGGNHATT